MQSLEKLTNLRTLELGGNRVREIGGLDSLGSLEELWLGRNRITAIANLGRCGPHPSSARSMPHPTHHSDVGTNRIGCQESEEKGS